MSAITERWRAPRRSCCSRPMRRRGDRADRSRSQEAFLPRSEAVPRSPRRPTRGSISPGDEGARASVERDDSVRGAGRRGPRMIVTSGQAPCEDLPPAVVWIVVVPANSQVPLHRGEGREQEPCRGRIAEQPSERGVARGPVEDVRLPSRAITRDDHERAIWARRDREHALLGTNACIFIAAGADDRERSEEETRSDRVRIGSSSAIGVRRATVRGLHARVCDRLEQHAIEVRLSLGLDRSSQPLTCDHELHARDDVDLLVPSAERRDEIGRRPALERA